MRYSLVFSPVALSLLAVTCAACTETRGNEDALFQPCIETTTVLTLEEASALGFSGADAMGVVAAPLDTDIVWTSSNAVTVAHMAVTHDGGEVRYVESVPNTEAGGDSGMELASAYECQSRLEVDVNVAFSTDDGVLAEAVSGTLVTFDAADVTVTASEPLESVAGTFTWELEEGTTTASLTWEMSFGASGASGLVMVYSEGEQGTGDDGVAWAGQEQVASWPVVE